MKLGEREKEWADKLRMLLYQKGYRRRFTLRAIGAPQCSGAITECLEQFLGRHRSGKVTLELETMAPYNDQITCRFALDYEPDKGYKIKELTVGKPGYPSRTFPCATGQDIPGSMSLEGLFKKPKPWEWNMKGKYRM
ncbi:MAG: hypothetical protein ACN6O7_00600 [Sphingobacterium sp.]